MYIQKCEEAIRQGDYMKLCKSLSNRLETVSMSMYPEIKKIKNNMLRCGADGALMSGVHASLKRRASKESI